MISKTLKIGLLLAVLGSFTFVNAQDRKEKKKGNPEDTFKKLDADANGSLSLEEFKAKRKKEDTKDAMIEKHFKSLDTDANNALSLDEFLSGRKKDSSQEERIEKRFSDMDADANGTIDITEYKAYLEQSNKRKGKRKPRRHKKD